MPVEKFVAPAPFIVQHLDDGRAFLCVEVSNGGNAMKVVIAELTHLNPAAVESDGIGRQIWG